MPYITRDDGEHFVIPSYRDVLTVKQKSVLKRDILLLSQNYGEYITLQRKKNHQYEVAFSPDPGYLLGESVWQQFKRPTDMIYCEAIANTTEALLVIVKAGSVYLDGRFPLDSIPEELIIFLTQQNNFEIFIYGNVPISAQPEEGKFSFEASSVKSFTVLEHPIFPTLPLHKIYHLELVDTVLKAHGIGVFPTKQLLSIVILIALGWMIYSYFSSLSRIPVLAHEEVSPYQPYIQALRTPAPDQEIQELIADLQKVMSIPGWTPTKLDYSRSILSFAMRSYGGETSDLFDWADKNDAKIDIRQDGFYLLTTLQMPARSLPTEIHPLNEVVGKLVDNLSRVYPGNHFQVGEIAKNPAFSTLIITINMNDVSPLVLNIIGGTLKDLPLVLQKVALVLENGNINGSITLQALGSPS